MIGCRDAESRFSRSPTSPTSKEPDSRIGGMRLLFALKQHGMGALTPRRRKGHQ